MINHGYIVVNYVIYAPDMYRLQAKRIMNILDFKEANCKNCYKCLRNCPVKAISFVEGNAQVVDQKCILCGKCIAVCPQNAKFVHSDIVAFTELMTSGCTVVASVAPSFISSFDGVSKEQLFAAIKSLGFRAVESTAVGAKAVTERYQEYLETGKYKNFITSACPAVVRLAEYSYPDALKYIAPVESPMVAHARIIKEKYGKDTAVVFIGPCIAKKREAKQSGIVDIALTYEELKSIFNSANIEPEKVSVTAESIEEFRDKSLFYPISRGIIKSFNSYLDNYDYVYVDGVASCIEVLKNIDNLSGMMIEMSACENSCVGGPCAIEQDGGFLKANEQVRKYARANSAPATELEYKVAIDRKLEAHNRKIVEPPESVIREILSKIGKETVEDELNCGACGYESCRDKAIAVYNGMANLKMCLPYMQERAESINAEMFQNSPNAVIIVDYDLVIQEMNSVAREFFGVKERDAKGRQLVDFVNPTEFLLAMNGDKIINKKIYNQSTDKWGLMSIYNVAKHDLMMCTIIDNTREEKNNEKMREMRMETAETTQKVIEKQMSIVQEIASLLGETTADTKVALTKLKNAVIDLDEKY